MSRLRLGISSCLLGERVRYDGEHKLDPFLRDTLGRYVEYVAVCPEVECGLPIPREPLHLVGKPAAPRLLTNQTGRDLTAQMCAWVRRRVEELEGQALGGFILKSKSPSCGMERVKVYDEHDVPRRIGTGLFAVTLMQRLPDLPVEEEGRLQDLRIRESFIERIFVMQRWRALAGWDQLAEFHARHELLLQAHSPAHERELARLVARGRKLLGGAQLVAAYRAQLVEALRWRATPAKHARVLRHVLSRLQRQLSAEEKQELARLIEMLRRNQLPLIVPLTWMAHHVRRLGLRELAGQVYLQPHPLEVQLRNHA